MSVIDKIYSLITALAIALAAAPAPAAAQQERRAVSGAEVTGTFRAKGGSEFKILALGRGRLRVRFDGVYEYESPQGPTANTGEAAGEAAIEADTAVFRPADFEDCTITLKFLTGGRLDVAQDGECGFGMNVTAAGRYKKISAAKPKF